MTRHYKVLLLVALLGLSSLYSTHARAQACPPGAPNCTAGGASGGGGQIAPQTCDSDVWMTMENRARLETEREIMQNQNLIFKPDSVLTYACFDSFAAHAAKNVGVLFTHTTYWDGKEIIKWEGGGGYIGMGDALKNAVTASMKTFIDGSYDHSLLGGRGQFFGLDKVTPTDVPQRGTDYACSKMFAVWSAAKCMNFMHNSEFAKEDGFYPFKNLAAGPGGKNSAEGYEGHPERRQWPKPCSGGDPVTGGWAQMYNFSKNSESGTTFNKYFNFGDPNSQAFDAVRKLIEPGSCGTAIKTGVKIILSPGSTSSSSEDGVCTNPGCTYTNGSCSASSGGSASP